MPSRDPLVEYLLELLAPLGSMQARRMFGGWGVYADGVMIGLVAGEALHLKVDEQTRAAFEAGGGAPFVFDTKGKSVATSYWSLPDEALDSPEAMQPWARMALDAALRKAAAKPVRKRAGTAARNAKIS
ncbi:MAG: TfoX/Sxy family protein [Luteimonas sp.]|nr:TfoX/Sxy family protein [Luteimonas sp.]